MADLEAEIAGLIRRYRGRTGRLLTIGTVESATGGKIADRITNVSGSSDYFKGSVVAYSNEAKVKIVGVKESTIELYGAVSEETALEMAEGGRRLLNVDVCISDTGIAGPTGGTEQKPVGLFYLGLAAEGERKVERHTFRGDREANKHEAAEAALRMLTEYLAKRLNVLE